MKQKIYNIFMFIAVCSLGILQYLGCNCNNMKIPTKDTINVRIIKEPSFLKKPPKDGLMEALRYYNVHHPDIVYAQARLETGNFKSDLCINGNNLFGLYNSKEGKYYKYDHWFESILDYVNYIQYKYKPDTDYYDFLESIGYAEDPCYIRKLKTIVK